MKLSADNTALFVIDVQEKIFAVMNEQAETSRNICRIIEGAKVLDLPVLCTEQYPTGLGHTLSDVTSSLDGTKVLEKITFSCLADAAISQKLKSYGRQQVLVCGIETHVCVYQTVQDLLEEKYDVHVVTDAIMSRSASNHTLGLDKMAHLGANMTSVEMALFELQRVATGDKFKAIASIIR